MSVEAIAWALTVPVTGNAKVTLLGIANHAHADGSNSFPGLDTLATYAHCDRSTARRNVRKLEQDGWIIRTGEGPRGQACYRLPLTRSRGGEMPGGEMPRGGTDASVGVALMPPEPTTEPLIEREFAPARARPRIAGSPVSPEAWELAGQILVEYNQQTGRDRPLLTSAGEPSNAAKLIYGRIQAYPDLGLEDHRRIIRNTLASRWWGEGRETINVIYGPRVFENNISRRPGPERARDRDSHQAVRERRGSALEQGMLELVEASA